MIEFFIKVLRKLPVRSQEDQDSQKTHRKQRNTTIHKLIMRGIRTAG